MKERQDVKTNQPIKRDDGTPAVLDEEILRKWRKDMEKKVWMLRRMNQIGMNVWSKKQGTGMKNSK